MPLLPDDPSEVGGYTLRARIGQGGMGTVFLSTSRGGRPIALKLVRQEFADSPDFRRQFATEVTIARRVQGAYTVPVVDTDTDAARPWVATSYVPAPNLSTVVHRGRPLPARTVLGLLSGVAEALESIHRAGVVHRDLKPANVIMAADAPLVIDFGLARAVEGAGAGISRPGVPLGTPAFMSPEQVRGGRAVRASDVFSLGSTAYFAATGEYPFGGDIAVFHRIEHTDPDWEPVPWPLRLVLERCLAKPLAHRASCEEIIELCGRLADELDVRTGSATIPTARRDLLGEGWLPDTVAAEITRYRRAAATTLPPRGRRRREADIAHQATERDSTPVFTPRRSGADPASRRRIAVVAAALAGALLLLAAGLLAMRGIRHGYADGAVASLAPVPTLAQAPAVAGTPALSTPTAAMSSGSRLTNSSITASVITPTGTGIVSVTPTQTPSTTSAPGLGDLLYLLLPPILAPAPASSSPPVTPSPSER
ncbi:serine/threonine-protein kinase [Frankia nepalensis]|uniref:serine/threonine-protein kinase n=1 Tax=Frankia nepalensis TaxID=1836974 RepID=UPI0027DD102E|nr:serine/threonine-protein kinase [Frankia nepalensis]